MGLLSGFCHSFAVFTKAWFKVRCSRVEPEDCDGRGKTEEGGYRLVRVFRPHWCAWDFDKDLLKCGAKT